MEVVVVLRAGLVGSALWLAACCCQTQGAKTTTNLDPGPGTTVTGFNRFGEQEDCTVISKSTLCTQEFTDEDQYRFDCEKSGGKSYQCACHKYLCSTAPK
jgi:hypothetical protein